MRPQSGEPDRILPVTRWTAALLLPFLFVAWILLYFFPGDTASLFAWPITPRMTALLFGSAYLAGVYFFFRVAAGSSWNAVRLGFVPVAVFAATEALATILHWVKFTHTHIAFFAWAGLYFTTPWVVLGLWLLNRRSTQKITTNDVRLPPSIRLVMGMAAAACLAAIIYFYLFPERLIAIWPWSLTPLTSRAMLGFFLLMGLAELAMALEPRWQASRLIIQAQMLCILAILLAIPRAWNDFQPGGMSAWLFVAALLLFLLFDALVFTRLEARKRQSAQAVTA